MRRSSHVGSQFDEYNENLYKETKHEDLNKVLSHIDSEVKLAQERQFGGDPTAYIYVLHELRKTLYDSSSREYSSERTAGMIMRWRNTQYAGCGGRRVNKVCDDYFDSITGPFTGCFAPDHLKVTANFNDTLDSLFVMLRHRNSFIKGEKTSSDTVNDILLIIDEAGQVASERNSDLLESYLEVLLQLRRALCELGRYCSNPNIIETIEVWRDSYCKETGKKYGEICDDYFLSKKICPSVGFFVPSYLNVSKFTALMDKVIEQLKPSATPTIG